MHVLRYRLRYCYSHIVHCFPQRDQINCVLFYHLAILVTKQHQNLLLLLLQFLSEDCSDFCAYSHKLRNGLTEGCHIE